MYIYTRRDIGLEGERGGGGDDLEVGQPSMTPPPGEGPRTK